MERLIDLMNELAKRRGVDLRIYLVNLLNKDLDPNDRVRVYLRIHEELLGEFNKEYDAGNLV